MNGLREGLVRADAYPHPVGDVEVRETHLSLVFLAGEHVYKLKKPVRLPFVDQSTQASRRAFCEAEVRLNRRLAPSVYLGVVPITRGPQGIRIGGDGEVIEHAVHMARLPDAAALPALLDVVSDARMREIGALLAGFHASAARGPEIRRHGRRSVVATNARDNLDACRSQVGALVHEEVCARLAALTDRALDALGPEIEARAAADVPCEGHGDLRLEHVYDLPGRGIVIVDCVEFSDALRCGDPVSDVAFLSMDLGFHGRPDLARALRDGWFEASGDAGGRALLPLYESYRSAVRAKVRGIQAGDDPAGPAGRKSRGHWLYALGALEVSERRPGLVLVGGLPGTGKSTLAAGLAERAGFEVVRSDVVRKELAGLAPTASGRAAFGKGLYSSAWTERTYTACRERAEAVLFRGGRVVVDASFTSDARRRELVSLGREMGVRTVFLACEAPGDVVRERIAARTGDASDADVAVYERSRWEPPSDAVARVQVRVGTGGTRDDAVRAGIAALRGAGLA